MRSQPFATYPISRVAGVRSAPEAGVYSSAEGNIGGNRPRNPRTNHRNLADGPNKILTEGRGNWYARERTQVHPTLQPVDAAYHGTISRHFRTRPYADIPNDHTLNPNKLPDRLHAAGTAMSGISRYYAQCFKRLKEHKLRH